MLDAKDAFGNDFGIREGITTLKVRVATRDEVVAAARRHGTTVDEYLAHLLEEESWRHRMMTAREAMAQPDKEYLDEVAQWDGLEDE